MPGYAKLVDAALFQSAYAGAVRILSLMVIPAAFGIFAVAAYAVPVFLGPKWIECVPLIQILAISGAFQVFRASMSTVLIAKGFVAPVVSINFFFVIAFFGAMAAFVPQFGLLGVAYVTLAVTVLTTPMLIYQLRSRVQVPLSVLARAAIRPLLASIVMALAVGFALPEHTAAMSLIDAAAWLMVGVILGATVYVTVVLVLWAVAGYPAGGERYMLGKIRVRVQGLMKKARTSADP